VIVGRAPAIVALSVCDRRLDARGGLERERLQLGGQRRRVAPQALGRGVADRALQQRVDPLRWVAQHGREDGCHRRAEHLLEIIRSLRMAGVDDHDAARAQA